MSKHTPGPWEKGHSIIRTSADLICESPGGFPWAHENKQSEANANLIAAAPELLEALETVLRVALKLECYETLQGDYSGTVEAARAAIKKARGGE